MNRLIALILVFVLAAPVFAADQYDLPKNLDIVMLAGADFNLYVTHVDPTTGLPINLTGTVFYSQFRSAPAPGGTIFATYSTPVVNAAAGKSRVSMSKARTLALSGKYGVWDLLMVSSSGIATYVLSGKAAVKPTATTAP